MRSILGTDSVLLQAILEVTDLTLERDEYEIAIIFCKLKSQKMWKIQQIEDMYNAIAAARSGSVCRE
jgi:hypothetical protein